MKLSVIFTTYNSPLWLEKVLWGYQYQEFKNFEVIVADDGSTSETSDVIKRIQQKIGFNIKHIWQNDRGFRKCEILNKAIVATESDYLVFSDGDCIPRADFLKVHFTKRKNGYYLSGGYFKLPIFISEIITENDIASGRSFDISWLKKNGLKASFKNSKLFLNGLPAKLMNAITPTNDSWNGHNSSAWKKDIMAVNGFDERMRYGSEDREFGERLMNNGAKGKQIRYSAICLHLDHSRNYVNQTDLDNNAAIRKETKEKRKVWTDFGIVKKAH
ncbi:MAG: glycosyltransferase family 2 protein [Ginsengibacter sp.]